MVMFNHINGAASFFFLCMSLGAVQSSKPFGRLTLGTPWPMPRSYASKGAVVGLNGEFEFQVVDNTCDVLEAAFDRCYASIFDTPRGRSSLNPAAFSQVNAKGTLGLGIEGWSAGFLKSLTVNLTAPCDVYPTLYADESYSLSVSDTGASLSAASIWGALYGLETFSQLVWEPIYESHGMYSINITEIEDSPRFPYRGMMLDTARHYFDVGYIKQFLDLMSMNKMNVFHWHIVDDSSFPYRSRQFPDLSQQGAYQPYTHVYDHADIADVVEYARVRGIRVVPEFDTPGHTQSWGKGQPDLLTECYSADGKKTGEYGPVDPTKDSTYDFMKKLLTEVFSVFPDKSIHLGGDEVSFSCWQSSPVINAWMKKMNISGDYAKLESYYVQKVLDLVTEISPKQKYTVWQEVFDNGVKLKPDTIVEVWKGSHDSEQIRSELANVTKAGYQTILSAGWYLNYIAYGEDWVSFYYNDPQKFTGSEAQKKLVIGGEACMWSEWVDGTNVISRTWPRASAVAERLWSPSSVYNATLARDRLEVHRCRMLQRGYSVEPVYISYCPHEIKPYH